MINYLDELHHIMSLLYAYNIDKRLSHIPCPLIFSHICKNLIEILALLEAYKNDVKDYVELKEPDFFSFPEDGQVDPKYKYTINLSALCERISEFTENMKELIQVTIDDMNNIIKKKKKNE